MSINITFLFCLLVPSPTLSTWSSTPALPRSPALSFSAVSSAPSSPAPALPPSPALSLSAVSSAPSSPAPALPPSPTLSLSAVSSAPSSPAPSPEASGNSLFTDASSVNETSLGKLSLIAVSCVNIQCNHNGSCCV